MGKRYAVFGHPVSHSLSPLIHAAFARQAGIELEYVAIDAPDFAAALAAFDGDGANVTLPHKAAAAAALCGRVTLAPSPSNAASAASKSGASIAT